MELGALVSESFLTGAESTEILSCLGDYIIIEEEIDAAILLCRDKD